MEDKKLQRDEALDAVKGIAILIVMLGHCIVLNDLADPWLYNAIYAVQMPLFMLISGFLAAKKPLSPKEKPEIRAYLRTLGKRSIAYLVPFFSWLWLTHPLHPVRELRLQLFALDRGLWFLMTLWVIVLVTTAASYAADLAGFYAKKSAPQVRLAVYGAVVAVCYLGFVFWGRSGNTFLSPALTVKYLPFYVAGYLWACYAVPFLNGAGGHAGGKTAIRLLWLLSGAAFVYFVVTRDLTLVADAGGLLIQMLASLLGSAFLFYGVYSFAGGGIKKGLALIGQYTLEIYVLHFRFARILPVREKGLTPLSMEAAFWILLVFLLMAALTALGILVIGKIPFLNFLLFGKRRKQLGGKGRR